MEHDSSMPSPDIPGFYYDATGQPWAVVKRSRGRTLVFIWSAPEPYPDTETVRRLFGLSPRQAHTAQLLVHGRTNQEIAAALNVTIHTARRHVESVMLRLGVSSRYEVEQVFRDALGEDPAQR